MDEILKQMIEREMEHIYQRGYRTGFDDCLNALKELKPDEELILNDIPDIE